jgi:hypothetical protein
MEIGQIQQWPGIMYAWYAEFHSGRGGGSHKYYMVLLAENPYSRVVSLYGRVEGYGMEPSYTSRNRPGNFDDYQKVKREKSRKGYVGTITVPDGVVHQLRLMIGDPGNPSVPRESNSASTNSAVGVPIGFGARKVEV